MQRRISPISRQRAVPSSSGLRASVSRASRPCATNFVKYDRPRPVNRAAGSNPLCWQEPCVDKDQLERVARAMVAKGKGLLAADESSGTIKKRFDAVGIASTAETRRDYREFMFRTRPAMAEHISGVILYDETIRQIGADGTPLVKLIEAAGALPGIKVDLGAKPMPGFPGETITEGLDGLAARLKDYYALGARFAKWRAVI